MPHNWSHKPGDYPVGQQFRLLALTTGGDSHRYHSTLIACNRYRDGAIKGRSTVPTYNAHGRWFVGKYGGVLAPYRGDFRAVVSGIFGGHLVSARDNTDTGFSASEPGVPVWWVRGSKVADDYADFYDGSWDNRYHRSVDGVHTESSSDPTGYSADGTWRGRVWTGSTSSGLPFPNHYVATWPVFIGFGETEYGGRELSAGITVAKPSTLWAFCQESLDIRYPFYVLSPVFEVVAAKPGAPTNLGYTPKGTEIDLTWDALATTAASRSPATTTGGGNSAPATGVNRAPP